MFKKAVLSLLFFSIILMPVFSSDLKESTLTIDASINNEVAPDCAKIRFSVEDSGINLANLKEKNDKIINDAISAIKLQLNNDETVKTTAFNVRNVYSYKEKVRVFQKYSITNSFEVKLKDLTKVSKIINVAMQNGVKNVDSVSFMVENSENVCNQMMAQAVKIAKNRAKYVANSADSEIDKIKSINPYCSLSSANANNRIYKNYGANATMDLAAAETSSVVEPIEIGSINARANVNMIFYLK